MPASQLSRPECADLGFFRGIQALRHQLEQRNIDEVIAATEQGFWSLGCETLTDAFLSLQMSMIDTVRIAGSNRYRAPHIGKSKREGKLPDVTVRQRKAQGRNDWVPSG